MLRRSELIIHVSKPIDADLRQRLRGAATDTELGLLRVDEPIVSNIGIGGGPGFGAELLIYIAAGTLSGTLSGLLTAGIKDAAKRVFAQLRNRFPHRTLEIKVREEPATEQNPVPTVAYTFDSQEIAPDEEEQAFDALPADFEIVIKTRGPRQVTVRVWNDGRWQ